MQVRIAKRVLKKLGKFILFFLVIPLVFVVLCALLGHALIGSAALGIVVGGGVFGFSLLLHALYTEAKYEVDEENRQLIWGLTKNGQKDRRY